MIGFGVPLGVFLATMISLWTFYSMLPNKKRYLQGQSYFERHMNQAYTLTWLPLVGWRLLNTLYFSAECNCLTSKSRWVFDRIESTSEQVSTDTEKKGSSEMLEILKWKVKDMYRDWSMIMPVCLWLDLLSIGTGALAAYRLLVHFDTCSVAPLLLANSVMVFVLIGLQIRPAVAWNSFLTDSANDDQKTDPLLHMWINRGTLDLNILGITLNNKYFVATAVSVISTVAGTLLSWAWRELS